MGSPLSHPRQPHCHGAAIANGVPRIFDQLTQQSRTIFQRAAVFVAALVEPGREELERQKFVARVNVDDVKVRVFSAQGQRDDRTCVTLSSEDS